MRIRELTVSRVYLWSFRLRSGILHFLTPGHNYDPNIIVNNISFHYKFRIMTTMHKIFPQVSSESTFASLQVGISVFVTKTNIQFHVDLNEVKTRIHL